MEALSVRLLSVDNEKNLIQAIKEALGTSQARKHLEIWRSVSRRYPSTSYETFDRLMGKLEMDEVIVLTGSRGPNTYKLAK